MKQQQEDDIEEASSLCSTNNVDANMEHRDVSREAASTLLSLHNNNHRHNGNNNSGKEEEEEAAATTTTLNNSSPVLFLDPEEEQEQAPIFLLDTSIESSDEVIVFEKKSKSRLQCLLCRPKSLGFKPTDDSIAATETSYHYVPPEGNLYWETSSPTQQQQQQQQDRTSNHYSPRQEDTKIDTGNDDDDDDDDDDHQMIKKRSSFFSGTSLVVRSDSKDQDSVKTHNAQIDMTRNNASGPSPPSEICIVLDPVPENSSFRSGSRGGDPPTSPYHQSTSSIIQSIEQSLSSRSHHHRSYPSGDESRTSHKSKESNASHSRRSDRSQSQNKHRRRRRRSGGVNGKYRSKKRHSRADDNDEDKTEESMRDAEGNLKRTNSGSITTTTMMMSSSRKGQSTTPKRGHRKVAITPPMEIVLDRSNSVLDDKGILVQQRSSKSTKKKKGHTDDTSTSLISKEKQLKSPRRSFACVSAAATDDLSDDGIQDENNKNAITVADGCAFDVLYPIMRSPTPPRPLPPEPPIYDSFLDRNPIAQAAEMFEQSIFGDSSSQVTPPKDEYKDGNKNNSDHKYCGNGGPYDDEYDEDHYEDGKMMKHGSPKSVAHYNNNNNNSTIFRVGSDDSDCTELHELRREIQDLKRWTTTDARLLEYNNNNKTVRFAIPLVTQVKHRPFTTTEELSRLFFAEEELDQLEQDRRDRVAGELVECVASPDHDSVSVSFPARLFIRRASSRLSAASGTAAGSSSPALLNQSVSNLSIPSAILA